jgi:dihydroorotase-like cyclic amidohydrolase
MRYSKQQGVESFARIPNGAPWVETRLPLALMAPWSSMRCR